MSKLIYGTSRAMAWLGGIVLTMLAGLSVISITGRALSGYGFGPVPGDFELVEAGTAVAVFCFMPWAHLVNGHAQVDLFWHRFPAPLQHLLQIATDALMLIVWLLLVWRMSLALADYHGNGEVSFILQMPVWWGYLAAFVPAALGCVVYAWRLLEDLGLVERPARFTTVAAEH